MFTEIRPVKCRLTGVVSSALCEITYGRDSFGNRVITATPLLEKLYPRMPDVMKHKVLSYEEALNPKVNLDFLSKS